MERGRTLPPEPLDQESIPPGGQPPAATPLGMLQREHGLKAATHLHEGALGIWELAETPSASALTSPVAGRPAGLATDLLSRAGCRSPAISHSTAAVLRRKGTAASLTHQRLRLKPTPPITNTGVCPLYQHLFSSLWRQSALLDSFPGR